MASELKPCGNRIWFDTEFIEDGQTIDLISIGMVRSDGATYYAECAEADLSRADDWVKTNVVAHLSGETKPRSIIAREIIEFAGAEPEFWAYYADYDWVALCQLFGRMIDLPKGWPMFCRDLKQWNADLGNPEIPKQNSTEHHALADARWCRQAWDSLSAWNRRALPQEPSSASMGVVKAAEAKLSAYAFDEDDETEFSREDAVFILHALASLSQPAKGEREGGGQALVDADQNVASNEAAATPANPAQGISEIMPLVEAYVSATVRCHNADRKTYEIADASRKRAKDALTAALEQGKLFSSRPPFQSEQDR